jgi:hypothetical protein
VSAIKLDMSKADRVEWTFLQRIMSKVVFSLWGENFWVSHRMCRKDVERCFRILIKNKLQNPLENCKTNLMILINPSLTHVVTVALKAFHGLIRLKRFVSRFPRELCN